MDFSKVKGKFFFNNKFLDSPKATIPILNHSLHFAGAVFEGIRVYSRKPFYLKEHLDRLRASCELMELDLNLSRKELKEIIYKLININSINDGYIRPIVFRDSNSMSPDTRLCKSQIFIAIWNWKLLFEEEAISLCVAKYKKANNLFFPIEAKSSGSYQASIIEKIIASKKGFDDSLMLDSKNNIAETTACNIFWIKKNIVYTPKTHSILNGITRQIVIKILNEKGIKIIEGDFKLNHIKNADEIFVTGTATEIIKVGRLENKVNYKDKIIKFLKKEFKKLKDES
jgi:branched-chain amino acid aminotransferase